MHEGEKIISITYRSLETYLVIALIYLVLTSVTTLALRRIEKVLRSEGRV
jgi:polar amino acid transport system permease protein